MESKKTNSVRKKQILVIDNEPDICEILHETLTISGYDVQTALSGKNAINSIQISRPDLIICDIIMPNGDGLFVKKHLEDNKLHAIPIIFITGLIDTRQLLISQEAVIYKPIDMQHFKRKINKALAEKNSITEAT